MSSPLIALLTDFGTEDWYVGTMKGVIKSHLPGVDIIDITHELKPYDIYSGAFALLSSYKYFPESTVFCCVVDPGVGSSRTVICATDGRYSFTAPDNGILTFVAKAAGKKWRVYEVNESRFISKKTSPTFQGRDTFAPLAAFIAAGHDPEETGLVAGNQISIKISSPEVHGKGKYQGEIIYVDKFGNLITNIRQNDLKLDEQNNKQSPKWRLHIKNLDLNGLSRTFSDKKKGEILFYWGSAEYMEIAVNQGNAAEILNAGQGTQLFLYIS